MPEPSILDYLKSFFSRESRIDLEEYFSSHPADLKKKKSHKPERQQADPTTIFWVIAGSILAVFAQSLLEPPDQRTVPALILYALSAFLLFRYLRVSTQLEYKRVQVSSTEMEWGFPRSVRLIAAVLLLILAFFLFSGNRFNPVNISFWIIGSVLLISVFWARPILEKKFERRSGLFLLLLVFIFLTSAFFRFYRLQDVPAEMFSDHAEKLLDVMDVMDGQSRIFFPGNTGREGLQFYLTALVIRFFNTGISFMSLKIVTAAAGFLALPFIYLTGKEIFNRWVGLAAMALAGFSYWHNVISRIGLRFPLYPLFVSMMLYFLIKGLRTRNINDIILAGVSMGIGLHGYSPFRISLVLAAAIFSLFWFFEQQNRPAPFIIRSATVFTAVALALFLPLLRYMVEFPGNFHYRALSRLTSIERGFEGSFLMTFLDNLWKSLTMPFFRNGVIWVNSIPNRPALDYISASFFLIGLIVLLKRIWAQRRWEDVVLAISIPILMLPSILSIAYPQENPALNRSAGAVIPVFLISALGLYAIFKTMIDSTARVEYKKLGAIIACALIGVSARENFNLVFREFNQQFTLNAWNSSEMGRVISRFVAEGNSPDNAFVLPFPHWVDTRLVGINAGFPRKDYALWPDQVHGTRVLSGPKLFLIKPEDLSGLDAVELSYPEAQRNIFYSRIPGKDFYLVFAADR